MKKLYKLLLISLLILNGGNAMKAQSYNNDDSKSSSRAVTPTYISKIAVAYGAKEGTPKDILNNQGFTIIDYDLNKGCGSTSHYIYMGYKTTTNPAEAITGIFFRKGNNPPNYDTFDGVTAYLLGGSNETNPGENKAVDLNADAGGDYIYTYVTRDASRAAVINGMYFDGSSSASDYVTPNVNLNSGTKGGAIYLHYKQFSGKASATFHYLNSSGNRTSSTTSVSVKHHQQAVNNTPSAPTSVTYDGRTWTLLGWREDNNATTAGSNPSYTYMDSKVYRAVYSADVSITYNANGGSNAPSKQTAKQYVNAGSSSIAKSNTSFTIPSTTPTHDATKCNFAGWSTSSSSTTAQYQAGGSISIDKNTTLYAVWPEHNGTKTYVNNGSNHTYTWSCCKKSVTEDHIYDNGIDNYCGAHIHEIDGNGYCHLCNGYPAKLVNGYYEIYNADNLFWFAEYVNTIDRTASAKLMNDIDLENRPWTPIGTTGETSHNFRGHFDGNGKTITGLNVTVTRNGGGFFGEVRLGTVEDFTIYGEVKLNGNHSYVGGVIGSAPGANSNKPEHNGATIRNITSYVNVTLGEGSHGSNHVAGFIGYANHETLIENCTWYGTLDLDAYRAQDGVGGLVGKANDNSAVTIRNCAAYGTIKTSYKSGSYNSHNNIYIGGIVSNSVASAQTTLENCIWAGTLIDNTNLDSNAHISAIGTLNGIKSVSNCYALDNMPYITTNNAHNTGITKVTAGQLASGEIAYKLQGTQATQIWGQNIDNGETKETLPVLGGAKVYCYEFDSNSIYTNNEFELAPHGKCGDNLYWNVTNNTLTIFGTGAMNDYDNSGNKAPWRSLSTAPTSLVLEDGITHIGNYAFRDCSGFDGSLTIPNSVTTIGDYAFAYCSVFRGSLTIPNSVTTIGNSAFRECSGFRGSLTIPNSVTSIGNSAFENCYGFTGSLTIPNSVTSIGEGAFYKCSGFTGDLTIPNSVTNIGNSAFELCSGFTGSLTIPNSVTTIGNYAFAYCSGFTGFLTIPNSVTTIGNYAFYKCSGFTGSLTIGNSVTTIGNSAFYKCSGFTGSLTIGNSVTTIGNDAFYECSGFTGSLTIPNSVTTIGNSAFRNCSGFTGSLTIPNSVTSIGNHAFSNCSGFTGSLTISNSVTTIEDYAFSGCSSFTGSLTIGNSVTTIGNYAFQNCSSFTGSLTIPNSVTTIGNYAFDNCSGFTGSLTIPNSITYIGNYAFYNCEGFTEVYSLAKTAPTLKIEAFTGTNSNATLYYPASSEQSYNNKGWFNYFSKRMVFNGKCGDNLFWYVNDNTLTIFGTGAMEDYDNIDNKAPWRSLNPAPKSLVLEEGITYIGNYAFYGCDGFTEVHSSAVIAPTLGTDAFANINENATLYYPSLSEHSYEAEGWFDYFPKSIGYDNDKKCGDKLYWNVDDENTLTIFGIGAMYDYGSSNKAPWRSLNPAPTSLVLEEGITSIGDEAFYQCSGFTGDLTIPNSVTSIGEFAFALCSGFTGSLTIGNSVTTIGDYAFYECLGFNGSLTIPNSVTSIGNSAFQYCSSFTGSLTIGNSVTSIRDFAFDGCSSFTGSLIIGNSVTSIGNSAFYDCEGFTEVYSSAVTAPTLGTDAFANINENATLYYPVSSEQSYNNKGWFNYFPKHIGYDNDKKCGDNLYWNVDDTNTLTIFGTGAMYDYSYYGIDYQAPWRSLNPAPTSLVLEEGITTIGNYAFYNCKGFTGSLTIPNSVTTIGDFAFAYCSGFTGSLTIPNSVTTIGDFAFDGCSGFTGDLTIGNSVTYIGNSAFQNCSGFTGDLTIPNSVTSIGNSAFYYCNGFTGSLTIPNSVTSIGNSAFYKCSGFTGDLTIPNSVTSIGDEAFAVCRGFTGSLTIGNSVTSIGNSAFVNCSGFTGSLTIPNSVTTIGNYAFYQCSSFTEVYSFAVTAPTLGQYVFDMPNNATLYYPVSSEQSYNNKGWFNYFSKRMGFNGKCGDNLYWNIDDENTLTIFGTSAMDDYDNIDNKAPWLSLNPAPTSLVLEKGITYIGNYAFYECYDLTDVHSSAVTAPTLGTDAFANINENATLYYPSLSEYSYEAEGWFDYFPKSIGYDNDKKCGDNLYWNVDDENTLTIFGTGAMYDYDRSSNKAPWRSLNPAPTSLVLEEGITSIGNYAFYECSGFKGSLTIPNSVTSIGMEAFRSCIGFDGSLTIPNSVTSIGDEAFQFCSGFKGSLTIPNSVTTIGDYAFQNCSGFTGSLTIGNSVTTIGDYAFQFCSCFTGDLTIPNSVTTIGDYAFYYCSGFTGSLTIPNSVTTIGDYAFRSCIGFTGSLTIPNSVTSIGDEAFRSCIGFDGSLTIPNSVTSIGDYAFQNCSGFNGSLTIPNSVTTIGDYAFQFCSGFTEIFFYRDTNPTIGSDAFSSINDNAKVYAPVIWESFSNIPEDKLVKMATFVGQQTTDASTGSATINGWIGLAEGHWPDEDDHVAINAPLVLGSQQDYKTTRLQAEDDGSQQPIANSLSVKSFGLCGNENTTNGSSITIEDGGQLYCEIANGEVTVKKEILGYQQSESESGSESGSESESKWYTIASPLKDAIQITPNSTNPQLLSSDLYRYDEPSHTWQNAKNSANNGFNTIEPGRGYLYANAKNTTLEFKGNINTETVTYNLTAKSDVLNGFHLVGNPFTHDITFAHLNATEGASLVNGYYVLNGEGAWGTTLGSNEDDVIKVGQGILVKATAEGTLAIAKTTSQQDYKTTRGQQTTDNEQQSLCISVSNAKYSDRAFVVFDKGVGLDKMNHENENIPLLYIPMEDADYAIAMMDINVNEIPVNFETNVMGEYTISLRQENCEFDELYLLDKETNTTVNILEEDYTFIATSNDSPERFVLLMNTNGQQPTANSHFAYINNGDIVIYNIEGDADIRIFDALGRCVYQGESSDETTRIANGYSSGVYMIHKIDDNGVNVQKIIL